MATGSKIRYFLLLITLLFAPPACEKDENVIPDVYVNFYIDLGDPEFYELNAITNHIIVTAATNNLGPDAAGFAGSGIIIYHAQPGEFYAFDRTCPHDYANGQVVTKVNVDGIYAICPECETNYALPSFGAPTSGPGRHQLKNYRTSFDGYSIIRVWNN